MALNNCKSVSFEHPGCLHITLDDGSGLVVGSSGLDWYATDPDTGEWDLGAAPTNSIGFPNNEDLAAFASPVESTSTEHTGGNVYVDVIELESGAAVSVGCDSAIAWPTVADARRMLDGDESTLDAALAVVWLFEA